MRGPSSFADHWTALLVAIMQYQGGPKGGTKPRLRRHHGRSRWEGHRIRKAKRLERPFMVERG